MTEVFTDDEAKRRAFEILSQFESLGANCEFGFVQEKCEVNVASLFRWAEIPSIDALMQVINSDFENIYKFENIEPFNEGMVRDRSNWIAWHSSMRSRIADPTLPPTVENHVFIESDADRKRLYEQEVGKVAHLIHRTRDSIKFGSRTFIYKDIRGRLSTEMELERLQTMLNKFRHSNLLYVTVASKSELIGTVELADSGVMYGYVERFAPGDNASDVSLESWISVCEGALRLANSKGLNC